MWFEKSGKKFFSDNFIIFYMALSFVGDKQIRSWSCL